MPRIDDDVLDCGIYLYGSEEDALEGEKYGGSGFLVGVPFGYDRDDFSPNDAPTGHHLYAVTNEHVARCNPVIRLSTKSGELRAIGLFGDWVNHQDGDDLSVAPIGLNRDLFKFKFVSLVGSTFITEKLFDRLGLGPGDETFMVGRFIGRDERQSNVPVVRFGHISGSKPEPIRQDKDRGYYEQESFLVECHSVGGSSGSPVFVWIPQERAFKSTFHSPDPNVEKRLTSFMRTAKLTPSEFLLGIDWGHLDEANPAGMAGVVPAWKLLNLLKSKELVEMRQAKEREMAQQPHGKLDVKHAPTQRTHPQQGEGIDIPVPERRDFLGDLYKVMRRKKPSS